MKEALAKQHLHGKLIEPEQFASVAAFLFTDGASGGVVLCALSALVAVSKP
jgi:hypothetical protein